jgi:hypothetical protein
MNFEYPLLFKKALVKGFMLTKDEVLFQTIYNNKCLSSKTIFSRLPGILFEEEIKSKSKLKLYLNKKLEEGSLIRDRAPDLPQFKKGGYAVNVEVAYKDRYPYTMMGLDPLPVLSRSDYIYHLFLNKDAAHIYSLYPQDKYSYLDRHLSDTIYFCEMLFENLPDNLLSMNENLAINSILDARVVEILKNKTSENKKIFNNFSKERWENLEKNEYFLNSNNIKLE